jgi:hypothetical protein
VCIAEQERITKGFAVVIVVAAGLTVRPSAASVAPGIACARATPAALRTGDDVGATTVQTSQLLVMREPLVALELPLVFLKGVPSAQSPGVNP